VFDASETRLDDTAVRLIDGNSIVIFSKIDKLARSTKKEIPYAHTSHHITSHNTYTYAHTTHKTYTHPTNNALVGDADRLGQFLDAATEHFKTNCTQQPLIVCGLSVQTEEGLQNFLKEMTKIASDMMGNNNNLNNHHNHNDLPLMTRARHREHMAECLSFLQQFQDHVSRDLVKANEDLRQAAQSLGRIVGVIDVDELLEVIFRDFCIGK